MLLVAGAFFDLLSTWYFIKLNTKAWPIGLIASVLNTWIYWNQGIYTDMFLSCFYCLNLSYGWYAWHHPARSALQFEAMESSKSLKTSFWIKLTSAYVILFFSIYFMLIACTNTKLPMLDATTAALSIIGQWLMCHKVVFVWIVWLITDLLYIVLYLLKNLPGHAFLMIIYTGLAIAGFYQWKRSRADRNSSRGVLES